MPGILCLVSALKTRRKSRRWARIRPLRILLLYLLPTASHRTSNSTVPLFWLQLPPPSPAPASTPAADPDAVANISRKLDVLLGKIEDLTTDSNELKDKVATLKDKVATSEKLSEERVAVLKDKVAALEKLSGEQDAEITVLKDRVAALERLSEEQDAAYEDIHGWLVTVRAFDWSLCTRQPDHIP